MGSEWSCCGVDGVVKVACERHNAGQRYNAGEWHNAAERHKAGERHEARLTTSAGVLFVRCLSGHVSCLCKMLWSGWVCFVWVGREELGGGTGAGAGELRVRRGWGWWRAGAGGWVASVLVGMAWCEKHPSPVKTEGSLTRWQTYGGFPADGAGWGAVERGTPHGSALPTAQGSR